MSFKSAAPRPGNRAASSALIIFLALLLASMSAAMPKLSESRWGGEVSRTTVAAPSGQTIGQQMQAQRAVARGLFVPAASHGTTRSYHPTFQTSDSAGALGFWILISLCAVLLTAAIAPRLIHWLRRRDR
jgi:hypothetical protein